MPKNQINHGSLFAYLQQFEVDILINARLLIMSPLSSVFFPCIIQLAGLNTSHTKYFSLQTHIFHPNLLPLILCYTLFFFLFPNLTDKATSSCFGKQGFPWRTRWEILGQNRVLWLAGRELPDFPKHFPWNYLGRSVWS